jgi:hypothetical protein
MPTLAATDVLAIADVLWRKEDGEVEVLDPAGNKILGLNGTGRRMWELLDGARTLKEIAGQLAEAHGVSAKQSLKDVLRFAEDLLSRQLVAKV